MMRVERGRGALVAVAEPEAVAGTRRRRHLSGWGRR